MLEPGSRIPAARVWLGPREELTLEQLVEDAPVLLFFYLFDWSGT